MTPLECIELTEDFVPIRLSVTKCVDLLIEMYNFVTVLPENKLLYYHDGIYTEGGEELAQKFLDHQFGQMTNIKGKEILNRHVMSEIMAKLKARTYVEQYKQLSPVRVPTFDSDLNIINMCNGLYNWRTEEFSAHTPSYKSRIQIPVMYDPNADCPTLREIIHDVFDARDREKFYEVLAYVLYRAYPIQKSIIFFGPAGTGKSQMLDLIQNFVGFWNTTSVTIQDLGGRRPDPYATAKLYQKLVNLAGDLDCTTVPEVGKFKMLTSGSDLIPARMIYGRPFEFSNFAKLIMSANELPEVNDRSDGFYRRLEIFKFNNKFTSADSNRFERLRALSDPYELSGLFNEVIPRLPELLERRAFKHSMTIDEVKRLYHKASNPLESFLLDCVEDADGEYISKQRFYELYVEYCKRHNLAYIQNEIAFGLALKKYWADRRAVRRMYEGKQKQCWTNVRVKLNF